MTKFLLFVFSCLIGSAASAQVFNGTGGNIPDAGATATCFPLTVTGLGTMDGSYGLATVCINITHTYDGDLDITLKAPDGTIVPLSLGNGSTGDNYTNTCFNMSATVDISGGLAPFTGSFLPEGNLGMLNNGQSGSGVWSLCIKDLFASEVGTLNSWSLTFSNSPAPPVPVLPGCSGNPPAGDNCSNATPVCNFDGYCGNTSAAYNVDLWPELDAAFCGTTENNSFITFVASATTANFNVYVTNSEDGLGIQMFFYDGGCGSGAVTSHGCYSPLEPDAGALPVTATNLTPGNTYYLMFDGYAGDVCDYSIVPLDGVNILSITPAAASICVGQSVSLTASGGNGTYGWSGGAGLSATTGATVTATPVVTTTYTVTSADPTGSCPVTKNVTITITNVAPPPTVTSPVVVCQGSTPAPLTATGTSLSWFTAATGGTGSPTAPSPPTGTVGSTTYYVSQTLICGESVRVPIIVNVVATPAPPTVTTPVTVCQGMAASPLTATGTGLLWYTTATGGTGNATAPVPNTAVNGTTNYYVSQTIAGCEGPRAVIAVTVTTMPAAPTVVSPVAYCQGNAAVALSATGTNLLWYTAPAGGTGSAVAPIPSTAAVGTTVWYVSQATGTCRGPRASVVVNVVLTTPPPTTSPVAYCQGNTAVPLTATGTGLLWYTAATGGTGSATAPTPSTAASGTTTYYVTQTLSCGESVRTPLTVTVTAAPALPAVTSPVTYCQGTTAIPLSATGSGLLWYTTATGGTGTATAPTPSTSTIGNTVYYVSQTMGCEGPRAPVTVTVNAIPVAPVVTATINKCQGTAATALTATGSNLLWYTAATGGTGTAAPPTPPTTTVGTTIYYVSQTVNNCEGPRAAITVNILNSTPQPLVTSPVVYCQGTAATALTATGTALKWYTVATGGTGSATAPIPSTATAGSTTYYVTQTVAPCGESVRRAIVVNINPTPGAPTVTTPVIYCQGTTAAALTATGTSLLWYTTPTGGTGSSAPVPSTATTGNTTYYVSQSTGACEGPRAALTVRINPIPLAPAVTPTFTYCQGIPAAVLTATGSNLLWYTGATGGTGSATAPTPATTTPGDRNYYVSQTVNGCEGPRALITVTTLPPTPAPAVTTPVAFCQGTTATALTATGTGLLWYTSATGGTGSATAPVPSTGTVGSTTYYVSQTQAACGESVRAAVVVNIDVTPVAPSVVSPLTYCQDVIVNPLTATGTNLLWYSSATGGTGNPAAPAQYTATVGTTTYYVSQTTGVCEGPRAGITVTINSYPDFGPDLSETVCDGDSVNLTNKFNTAGYTTRWTFNNEVVGNPAAVKVTGPYQLEATNSVGCSDTVIVNVTIQPPVPAFAGNDTIAIKGVPHQLMASGGVEFLWTPSAGLNFATIQNPLVTLEHDQQFHVKVTDAAGCEGSDIVFVQVYDGPTYYVPNAFSPNGDGLNDIFRVVPVGISQTDWFRVFNRFGQLVFETNKWLKGWDGTYLGKKQPVGNYVWMVKGVNRYGKIVEMKGTVMIVQ